MNGQSESGEINCHDTEEITQINPGELTFLFELSESECHQKRTGKCSLDKFFPDRRADTGEDADFDYCRDLRKSLKKEGVREPLDLIKYRCGHYGFNNGQHRVCIAKKIGINHLPAVVTSLDAEVCAACRKTLQADIELR